MDEHGKYYRWLHEKYHVTRIAAASAFTEEEAVAWTELKNKRSITRIEDLPGEIKQKMEKLAAYIFQKEPTAKIKLTGSWYKGSWVDTQTDPYTRTLREKITGKKKESDFDIVIQSVKKFGSRELTEAIAMQVHVWNVPYKRARGIEIKNPTLPELANYPRRAISCIKDTVLVDKSK